MELGSVTLKLVQTLERSEKSRDCSEIRIGGGIWIKTGIIDATEIF